MDEQKLIYRLFQVIVHNVKHEHYKHTVKKHKTYMQLVAGVGLDELLRQYVKREDADLFEQRKRLTQHIVTAVSKNLMDVFYKVPRSNSARRVVGYSGTDTENKTQELEGLLSKFWGSQSWDDYMQTRFIELNAIDPNSFVVFEWDDFDSNVELIQPRPFEVKSSAAVDYKYDNQVLQYLIVKDKHWYEVNQNLQNPQVSKAEIEKVNKDRKEGSKYTLYMKNRTIQLLQVSEEVAGLRSELGAGVINKGIQNGEEVDFVRLGKEYYQVIQPQPHNCDQVPAFRVGYYRDLATDGETYVNPIHAAEPYLLKSIKTNSELDLVAANLAFPQQIKLGAKCDDSKCYGGKYTDGTTCPTCNGTNVKATAPSSLDAIILPVAETREQHIPIGEYMTYIHPPVEIVEWQEKYVDKLTQQAKSIMFNSDVFSKKQISDTATGKNLDMQNVYDTLYSFAISFSRRWGFGVHTMGKLADRDKGLTASYTFGKDFKLKSLDTLILDLSIANSTGNTNLIKHLNRDIAQIIFAEKPLELQRFQMRELYDPFNGVSEKETLALMSSPFISIKEKVLHANYNRIFDELELDFAGNGKNFYKLNRTEQRKQIYLKVEEIIKQLGEENPEPNLPLE